MLYNLALNFSQVHVVQAVFISSLFVVLLIAKEGRK
jgi:hypothetical protein